MEIVSDWELIWSKNSLSIDENVNAATDISHEQTRRYNITFKQLVIDAYFNWWNQLKMNHPNLEI